MHQGHAASQAIRACRVLIRATETDLYFKAPLAEVPRLKAIGPARFDSSTLEWVLPKTTSTLRALFKLYPHEARHFLPHEELKPLERINTRTINTFALPDTLQTPLWKHQKSAYDFVLALKNQRVHGGILAMWMGTGKTLIGVAVMHSLQPKTLLILCPLRAVETWPEEILKHSKPGWRVLITALNDRYTVKEKLALVIKDRERAEIFGVPHVIVVNYQSAILDPLSKWLDQRWDLIIADESHRIKSPSSQISLGAWALSQKAVFAIGMTGTPMPHSKLDIHPQMRFADQMLLGRGFHRFKRRYAVLGGFQGKQVVGWQHQEELEAKLATRMFCVDQSVLDLPPSIDQRVYTILSPDAMRAYREMERHLVTEIAAGIVTASNGMVKLLRLMQIASGHTKTEDGEIRQIDDSKARALYDHFVDIGDEPAVVFCNFHPDMDQVAMVSKEAGLEYGELSGRRNDYPQWKAGKGQILAVQLRAGSEAISLVRSRIGFYFSLGCARGPVDQSRARMHRPGQTRPVVNYFLLAKDTVDVDALESLYIKGDLIKSLLQRLSQRRSNPNGR